jgi:hypothetical protein
MKIGTVVKFLNFSILAFPLFFYATNTFGVNDRVRRENSNPVCEKTFIVVAAKVEGLYDSLPVPHLPQGGFAYRTLHDYKTAETIIIKVTRAADKKDSQVTRVTTEVLVLPKGQPVPELTETFKPSGRRYNGKNEDGLYRYRGEFENSLRKDSNGKYTLILERHFSEVPKDQKTYWIPPVDGIVPLAEGKGLPPPILGIAATVKAVGISPNEITQVKLDNLANVPTLQYVADHLSPHLIKALAGNTDKIAVVSPDTPLVAETIAKIFENGLTKDETFPFRYVRTSLTQMGLQIYPRSFSIESARKGDHEHRSVRTVDGEDYLVDLDNLDVEFKVGFEIPK